MNSINDSSVSPLDELVKVAQINFAQIQSENYVAQALISLCYNKPDEILNDLRELFSDPSLTLPMVENTDDERTMIADIANNIKQTIFWEEEFINQFSDYEFNRCLTDFQDYF